jgi:TusA-related sulfurtransferase
MSASIPKRLVDSRGSFCPGPITDLFKAYRESKMGDLIELWATDPAAKSDVEAWAKRTGNTVLDIVNEPQHIRIIVRVDKIRSPR